MKCDTYKKMLVFATVLLFFGLTVTPTTNALNIKISKNLLEKHQTPIGSEFSSYKLLIISPTKFKGELIPLVFHKESLGIATRLVTLTEVYDQMYWHGRDEAEKIK